ncbi:rhombosortase [Aurantivibrio infirmus]
MKTDSLKFNLPALLRHHFGIIVIVGACIGIQLLGLQSELEYQRANLFSQPARLLLAHLSHITWLHLTFNAIALLAINSLFFKDQHSGYTLSALFVLAIAVSIGLYWFSSDVQWYRGLSGVLHGFFVLGCIQIFKREKISASLLLSAILVKLIWEQFSSDNVSNMLGGAVVIVDAHLWGAVTGLLLGGVLALIKTINK